MPYERPRAVRRIRALLAAASAIVVVLTSAHGAGAGEYAMYQCRDAAGRPITIRSDWTLTALPGGELYNSCGTGGSLGIRQTPSGATGERGGSNLALSIPRTTPNATFSHVAFKVMIAPKWGDPNLSHGYVTVRSGGQDVDFQLLVDANTTWIDRVHTPLQGLAPTHARSVSLAT